MACWTSLLLQMGSGLIVQNSWTNGLLDKLVPLTSERFYFPAHYESSSWANGLLDKLARPKYDSFSFPTRYGSCRTGLFFPIGERFSFSSPLLVQQLDQWPDGHACSSQWERFTSPARYGSNNWTNGLLDKRVLPNRGAV